MDGIEVEYQGCCIIAIRFLEVVNGSQALGLASLSIKDFTSEEFELMTYLSGQIRKMGQKGK